MEPIQIIGLFCGCVAIFFALVAGFTYMKINKLFSLITEDQIEKVMPIVEKQRRRIFAYLMISSIFTIATIVLSVIHNM